MKVRRFSVPILLVAWLQACGEPALVEDEAGLMYEPGRARLSEYHAFLLKDHDIDYRVVTARGLNDLARAAVERFESMAVGSESAAGRGLLLLIDAEQDQVRLEVGYALEGVFPDAFVAYVEHRQMVPFFRRGRVADGILATTELIVTRVQNAKAEAGYDGELWVAGSGGGGAQVAARLGAGPQAPSGAGREPVAVGRSPSETLAAYFEAMSRRDDRPDLSIYTPETQAMLAQWTVTPAQMDNVVRAYRHCGAQEQRRSGDDRYAVIRYPIEARQCAPWFFRKMAKGWALDLKTMQQAIRFGRDNSWHFAAGAEHDYRFAFEDWDLDSRGYPRSRL